jgi:signal transduction histidine kinase
VTPGLSIRRRLMLASAALLLVALTIAAIGLNLIFDRHLERRFAQELGDRLLEIAGAFSVDGSGQPLLTRTPNDPRYNQPYSGAYWYVRKGPDLPLRSRSLWDSSLAITGTAAAIVPIAVKGPGASELMALERPVTLGEGNTGRSFVLGVALDRAEIQALSASFANDVRIGLALLGLILFAAASLQAGYGLQPLRALRRQLGAVHEGRQERLEGPFPAEVSGLTGDLNTLFDRQQTMLRKARERAGTLAHGLKTPLTILAGEARKLDLAGQGDAAATLRGQIDLIRRQVDRELARARAHGAASGLGAHADLVATVTRLIDLMRRMPRGEAIDWQIEMPPSCALKMDPDDLGEVLGNLLDNARKWTRSIVRVATSATAGGSYLIEILDDGPGIPEAYRARVIERGETSAASQDDSGLGLAIVKDVLDAYGSSVTLSQSALGGASIAFKVPAA